MNDTELLEKTQAGETPRAGQPVENFRAELHAKGIDYAGDIVADGRLWKFKAAGDHRKNSWYVLHLGPPVAGAYGCWKRGIKETWCERNGQLSKAEWDIARRHWQDAERERERAERERHEKARKTAAWILKHSKPVTAHGYLTAKGVQPHGGLRQRGDLLVLPLRNSVGVQSLQFIAPDKRFDGERDKTFLRGGRVAGCFFTVADRPDGALVICEGFATGASIHEATGIAVVCAMDSGNLLAVSKALREKFPAREIIIAADDDRWKPEIGNPGLTKATEAAKEISARLAVPVFADVTGRPTDFNDLHQAQGADTVKAQIEIATTPKETDEETFQRLAAMPLLDYERCRVAEAKRLGIGRVSTLDNLVDGKRPKSEAADRELQGWTLDMADVELWSEDVNGADVLNETATTFSRYVVMPDGAADALALWTAHCHCFECFQCTPRLNLTSPEKRCGKTTLLDVLALLVPRPLPTENLTPAVLFRVIESHKPTVLADECDSWLWDNEELRGLLNAGHRRGRKVYRCEGESFTVRGFNACAPAVLCGIGSLPGTLHHRSVVIPLERAKPGELRERFDSRRVEREKELCRKLARFCADNRAQIEACDPAMPSGAFNRLADNWRPLFAIAEIAGGDWPQRAAAAFTKLTAKTDVDAQGIGIMLLEDIRQVFNEGHAERMFSKSLVEALCAMSDRPWPEARSKSQKPITENWLANKLRQFKVSSKTLRIGDDRAKGYEAADFTEVFTRYLSVEGLSNRDTVTTRTTIEDSQISKRDKEKVVTDSNPHETIANTDLSRCHGSNPPAEAGELVL